MGIAHLKRLAPITNANTCGYGGDLVAHKIHPLSRRALVPLPPSIPVYPHPLIPSNTSTRLSVFPFTFTNRTHCTRTMSIQRRSKSAPQLAVSPNLQKTGDNTVLGPLYRRQQSFVHFSFTTPSTSRPRDEPFALSGFFPSYTSPLKENDDDERWNWLRGDEEEDAESTYTASEEDPTVPPTPVEYDESENPDRVIQREDKLGILRLREYQAHSSSPIHLPSITTFGKP